MQEFHLLDYHYIFSAKPGASRILILLHGTGGSADSMLEIADLVDPSAHILSIQGNVSEYGAARFFQRHAEGVYDLDDLAERTRAMEQFLQSARLQHQLDDLPMTLFGYSNGANMGISLLLNRSQQIQHYILARPLFPHDISDQSVNPTARILLLAGDHEPLASQDETAKLITMLVDKDATVTGHFVHAGHELVSEDFAIARSWLSMSGVEK